QYVLHIRRQQVRLIRIVSKKSRHASLSLIFIPGSSATYDTDSDWDDVGTDWDEVGTNRDEGGGGG
ncbi:MAG TPA: hypothetical protein VHN74_02950, partial [Candidatus Angelobacter sp.]|nr:hypothetical protein [Candidatus Angelobacter sp.]